MPEDISAAAFRALHARDASRLLVLPNVWDAMSARMVELAGASALATTSSGISWALGRPDGHGLSRDEMLDALGRITRAVRIPVSADIEGGYGPTPTNVIETVRGVIDAGAVGINLEDTPGEGAAAIMSIERQSERIAAARHAAADRDVYINARTDVYLNEIGVPESRFDEAVRRARAYLGAGADGIFIPGVVDGATVERLVAAIDAPLNILAGPGAPSVPELRAIGVRRVSVGSSLARSVMSAARRAAATLLDGGEFDALQADITYGEMNALFSDRG